MLSQIKISAQNLLSFFVSLSNETKQFTAKGIYFLLPVKKSELPKFISLAVLMFTILLNQNVVRGMKDCMVMTMIGPEVISFIKLWGETPAALGFVILYSVLCNHISTERLFRYIVSLFLLYFAFFSFVIFPNHELLHPDVSSVNYYIDQWPNLKWFVVLWGKWSFVMFYILGELWPVIVFSLLFWQLANKINKNEEARRYYTLFSFFGQSSLILSGWVIVHFSKTNHSLSAFFASSCGPTEAMFKSLTFLVIISGVICLITHKYITDVVMPNQNVNSAPVKPSKNKEETLKLSLKESFAMIMSSKYLGLICLMMICYSMSVNLIEGVWMSKAKDMYPSPTAFLNYQGQVLTWTGISTLFFALTGGILIRQYGWLIGAISTPIMIFFAGTIFFLFVVLASIFEPFLASYALSPLGIIVFVGALQNILGKGTKYSLFDATKEMVYVPLNPEMKTKGKAAVDIVGIKIGKSSGAIIQFAIFTIFPLATYNDIAGWLMVGFVGICMFWIWIVLKLDKEYKKITNHNSK